MIVTAPAGTRHKILSPVLRTLRADLLDCLQANLAVLADLHAGPGTHLRLGSRLRFGPAEASLANRLAEAELIGLQVQQRWDSVDGPALRALAEEHGTLYVVADAYTMGWIPYAGNQHMEHSFLLAGPGVVVDAYRNDTQWGAARPGAWRLAPDEFDASVSNATAISFSHFPLSDLDVRKALADNAQALAEALPEINAYVTAERQTLDDLVLDIWLLSRSRGLHAAWLHSVGEPADDADRRAQDWEALTAQSYVAMRRAQRGGAVSNAAAEELGRLLRAEIDVRPIVHDALRAVLHLDDDFVIDTQPLRTLPEYNSFRLLDVIDQVEARLGVALEPDDLTAESLRDAGSLSDLFAKAVRS